MSNGVESMQKLTYREAVREAIREGIRRDERAFMTTKDAHPQKPSSPIT